MFESNTKHRRARARTRMRGRTRRHTRARVRPTPTMMAGVTTRLIARCRQTLATPANSRSRDQGSPQTPNPHPYHQSPPTFQPEPQEGACPTVTAPNMPPLRPSEDASKPATLDGATGLGLRVRAAPVMPEPEPLKASPTRTFVPRRLCELRL